MFSNVGRLARLPLAVYEKNDKENKLWRICKVELENRATETFLFYSAGKHGDILKLKDGYEEAAGISTPSKEILTLQGGSGTSGKSAPSTPANSLTTLASDKVLLLTHEVRVPSQGRNQISVHIKFSNRGTGQVRELELSVSDTATVKLDRMNGEHLGVKVCSTLVPQASNDTTLNFTVLDVTFAQKVRCTLSYMLEASDGVSSLEKLDFWLPFPCSSFMIGEMSASNTLTDLLAGGSLAHRQSVTLETDITDFAQILSKTSSKCHLTIVERVGPTASLYSHSLQGHHVCLLFKFNVETRQLSVDGKSDCQSLLSALVDELRASVTAST